MDATGQMPDRSGPAFGSYIPRRRIDIASVRRYNMRRIVSGRVVSLPGYRDANRKTAPRQASFNLLTSTLLFPVLSIGLDTAAHAIRQRATFCTDSSACYLSFSINDTRSHGSIDAPRTRLPNAKSREIGEENEFRSRTPKGQNIKHLVDHLTFIYCL